VIVTCPSCGTRSRVPAAASGRPRCARCEQGDGAVVDRSVGARGPDQLQAWIEGALAA
jgi:hypothetical protein